MASGLYPTPVYSQSSRNAYGTIASSLAISFASRVVQEATRRARQLMDEPRPCSSMLSIQGSWMRDGCVGIVLRFDTKDGCDWFVIGSRLRGGLRTVEDWFSFPKVIGVGRRLCSGWKADEGEKISGRAAARTRRAYLV